MSDVAVGELQTAKNSGGGGTVTDVSLVVIGRATCPLTWMICAHASSQYTYRHFYASYVTVSHVPAALALSLFVLHLADELAI